MSLSIDGSFTYSYLLRTIRNIPRPYMTILPYSPNTILSLEQEIDGGILKNGSNVFVDVSGKLDP